MEMFQNLRALALAFALVLVGCGGGGGDASNSPAIEPGTFDALFTQPSLDVRGIEGSPQSASLSAVITLTGAAANEGIYLRAGGDDAVVQGVQGQIIGNMLSLTLTLRGNLAPGDYTGEFRLYGCHDEGCNRPAQGSPVRVPIRYHVGPNLQVQQHVALSRQGSEAAPEVTLPVTTPPEAGSLFLTVSNNRPEALTISFDGSAVRVTTQQVPAGTYGAIATLRSQTDERYTRTVEVQYSVVAPPGGEHPLSVNETNHTVTLQQGGTSTHRIVVTRPTWTSGWGEPELFWNNGGMLSLTSLGNGQYDAVINTAGLETGQYSPTVRFSAGPTGGAVLVRFDVTVYSSFFVDGSTVRTVTATSSASDLMWSHPVRMFDGSTAMWTAVSLSPLLHVINSTGQAGRDEIQLRVDPAALTLPAWGHVFLLVVSIDRPNTSPVTMQLSLWNSIPTLQRLSPSTLVGGSGRVYIEGAFQNYEGDPLRPNRLRVEGATLTRGRLVEDPRYLSNTLVLELDLAGGIAGQPVRVHVDSALLPTQVELAVRAPLRASLGYQALGYGSYRPGQFAPGLGAFYFSAPGAVYRWAQGPGGWTISQASVPGLIDVSPGPDEKQLFGLKPNEVVALHPLTFAQQAAGVPTGGHYPSPITFDNTAAVGARALSFSADGRALASMGDLTNPASHTVGTLCTHRSTRALSVLTDAPESCDPGSARGWVTGPTGSGTVRSANGHAVVGVNTSGQRSIYSAAERQWVPLAALPAGVMVSAVSDSGLRMVRNDGVVIDANGNSLGNLASVMPFTHIAAGYGLSSGGRFALVYGYRVTGTGSAQRAANATLWVVDLNNAAVAGVSSAPVLAAIALPNAVGCTSAFVQGEACDHQASISVAPGDGTAFLIGPRGIAVVPLPTEVTSAQPLADTRRSRANAKGATPAHRPATLPPLRGRLESQ
ncbi:MAG: hypothetical protein H7Y33_16335 [Cytophagales bacterium]|nr:hypothetical protein [Rhizobacter sp.]